jgi:hypothetical protein
MTGDQDEDRAEQVLRAVFSERATGRTTPPALVTTVRAAHRRRRRAVVSAAAAAAVVVGAAVPTGLTLVRADRPATDTAAPRPVWSPPGPAPAGDACLPKTGALPAPVPADQLPRQTGVRGSLGGDEALVDRVLVAGWRGLARKQPGTPTLDPRSARVLFVERAGSGVLARVTAFDQDRRWHASQWVVGRDRWFVPIGAGAGGVQGSADEGHFRQIGSLDYGADPLLISMQEVCGRSFGVVVASPDTTAAIAQAPRIGADARPVFPPGRSFPLAHGGVAVFPTDPVGREKVTVSRDGTRLAARQLSSEGGGGPIDAQLSPAEIAQAVRDGAGTPDGVLARVVVSMADGDLSAATADEPTGVQVVWGGPVTDRRRGLMVALTLPSGAVLVDSAVTDGPGKYGSYQPGVRGLLPAGQLGRSVLGFQYPDGLVLVVAPQATRAEVVLFDGTVLPVRLTAGGGGVVAPPDHAKLIRAFRADGSLVGSWTPGTLLPQLPRTF